MLEKILEEAIRRDASDVHLTVGQSPFLRVGGEILQSGEVLSARAVESFLDKILTPRLREELEKNLAVDFSYVEEKYSRRFRVNVYYQRKNLALALRLIAKEIPTLDKLGAPAALKNFFHAAQGLILVTGRTGSGKSTTLAAFLNELMKVRPCHLLTLEDPIEFEYATGKSFISQRELGQDFLNFADAIRDLFADEFSAIISQQLVKTSSGRRCAAEVLIANPASRSLIRQGKYLQLPNVMMSGRAQGMQTMDFALKELGVNKP